MNQELVPEKLKRLWEGVDQGRLTVGEFYGIQDRYLEEYRQRWEEALLLKGWNTLDESTLHELGAYLRNKDMSAIRLLCSQALSRIKGEWRQKVVNTDRESVELFYDESQAMLFELMWWHTLTEDQSPLAYVVALEFAKQHGCKSYLDFGSGVGSGGILFASHQIPTTLADISSVSLKFSTWRFKKRKLPVRHIDLKKHELPEDAFDFITAMDVFEHLVDPAETVHKLARSLRRGGFLFGRFHAEADEDRPHHIILDFEPTIRELESLGFVSVWKDEWLWGHEVFQKVEG